MSQTEDIIISEIKRLNELDAFQNVIDRLLPTYNKMLELMYEAGTPHDKRQAGRSDSELASQYTKYYPQAEDALKRFIIDNAKPEILKKAPILPDVAAMAARESFFTMLYARIRERQPHHAAIYKEGAARLRRAFSNLEVSAQQQAADFLERIMKPHAGRQK